MNPNSNSPPPPIRTGRIANSRRADHHRPGRSASCPAGLRRRWLARSKGGFRPWSASFRPRRKPDFSTPLPAEVQPFIQASIHARASGYLKNWYVDIGDT
jgi:hypothetical protein